MVGKSLESVTLRRDFVRPSVYSTTAQRTAIQSAHGR